MDEPEKEMNVPNEPASNKAGMAATMAAAVALAAGGVDEAKAAELADNNPVVDKIEQTVSAPERQENAPTADFAEEAAKMGIEIEAPEGVDFNKPHISTPRTHTEDTNTEENTYKNGAIKDSNTVNVSRTVNPVDNGNTVISTNVSTAENDHSKRGVITHSETSNTNTIETLNDVSGNSTKETTLETIDDFDKRGRPQVHEESRTESHSWEAGAIDLHQGYGSTVEQTITNTDRYEYDKKGRVTRSESHNETVLNNGTSRSDFYVQAHRGHSVVDKEYAQDGTPVDVPGIKEYAQATYEDGTVTVAGGEANRSGTRQTEVIGNISAETEHYSEQREKKSGTRQVSLLFDRVRNKLSGKMGKVKGDGEITPDDMVEMSPRKASKFLKNLRNGVNDYLEQASGASSVEEYAGSVQEPANASQRPLGSAFDIKGGIDAVADERSEVHQQNVEKAEQASQVTATDIMNAIIEGRRSK